MRCEMCGSERMIKLGLLGRYVWWRCRECGWEQNSGEYDPDDEGDGPDHEPVVVPFGTPDPGDEPDELFVGDERSVAQSAQEDGGWLRHKGQCRHGIDWTLCSLCG